MMNGTFFGVLSYLGALATSGLAQQVPCPPPTMGKLIFSQDILFLAVLHQITLTLKSFSYSIEETGSRSLMGQGQGDVRVFARREHACKIMLDSNWATTISFAC